MNAELKKVNVHNLYNSLNPAPGIAMRDINFLYTKAALKNAIDFYKAGNYSAAIPLLKEVLSDSRLGKKGSKDVKTFLLSIITSY